MKKRMTCAVCTAMMIFLIQFLTTPAIAEAQGPVLSGMAAGDGGDGLPVQSLKFSLSELIDYALKNSPRVRMSERTVDSEGYGIDGAKAVMLPRIDGTSGLTRYRYPMPLTPIVIKGPLLSQSEIPEFERTIYDSGLSLRMPLFRGGRLFRNLKIAEIRKAVAEDSLDFTKQDQIYTITALYYKIFHLERLLEATNQSVRQLGAHKKDVELLLRTGTVPKLDLLKTDVQLSQVEESSLQVKNSLESSYEVMKTLIGYDEQHGAIGLRYEEPVPMRETAVDDDLRKAYGKRADLRALQKRKQIGEERLKIARAQRLPDVTAGGQYGGQAGTILSFKENWYLGVRLTVPIFDGGLITSDINREKVELAKLHEEERLLKLSIGREVRDAHLSLRNARERIVVTAKTIGSAKENLRVETLKYGTGAGTTTDVIDAQTALLRAESSYYQAIYDEQVAYAYLWKVLGEDQPLSARRTGNSSGLQ